MKPYGNDIEPDCRYCAFNTDSVCRKKAELKNKTYCRRFLYDPLQRIPRKLPPLPVFKPEDFTI